MEILGRSARCTVLVRAGEVLRLALPDAWLGLCELTGVFGFFEAYQDEIIADHDRTLDQFAIRGEGGNRLIVAHGRERVLESASSVALTRRIKEAFDRKP